MDESAAQAALARFAGARGVAAEALAARLPRVLLQRAWKVCGTFARAVFRGKGEAYRRYLPAELALTRRLLGNRREDRDFAAILGALPTPVC